MEYIFNDNTYIYEKGDNDLINYEDLKELVTSYFNPYDYIFIDEAYSKLRLKGFYDSDNKKKKQLNDIRYLDDYIENYCSYGSKWVLLKKVKKQQK